MSEEICVLTTKDFTILEVMRDRCLGRDDPMAALLARKIETATVVFRDDVPANVATLNSRVTFSVDGRQPETRVISHDRMVGLVGMFLPITTRRGLALLGLAEGQEFHLHDRGVMKERIVLDKVLYQPETKRREKEAADGLVGPPQRRPTLRLVRGAAGDRPSPVTVDPDGFDDPGPSAA
ncbi:nucleoside-diphosphate kinase [Mesorhizobium xinjiangense]|uniref:nucleoside-diphosphate kinase n=1 Tax=Mesorhizobium xinjiangense TaxID=2678685 RepID=UPI0012EE0AEC|nr:nucleoside-diphosphate kinase [Mesorhizobium xinjiangense]